MFSKKTKYGIKAAFHLAKKYQTGPVLINDLAKQERIPQKFLETILLDLKNHGILQSKKGKGGGYLLGKPPDQITVGELVRILEGPLAPVSCVSQTAYKRCEECTSEELCEIKTIMKEVRDAMSNILDKTSLSDAIERNQLLSGKLTSNYMI